MTNAHETVRPSLPIATELNNLLQIITGTSAEIENVWAGRDGSEKYFAMLQASIERAEFIAAELVRQAAGREGKLLDNDEPATPVTPIDCFDEPPRSRLLVVDDDQVTLTLLTRLLGESGYDVECAQSGFQCLDMFTRRAGTYDLVIIDFSMPFMDGAECFERLRALSPTLPVILMTGFIEPYALSDLYVKGLAAYLRKPFSAAETVACVHAVLDARPAENLAGGIVPAI